MEMILAQAMWILGVLSVEELPAAASNALEAGKDSASLRLLAGLTHSELTDAPELFAQSLKDLGLPTLSRPAAARLYATAVSNKILSGDLNPQDGAKKILDVSIRVNDPDFHELDTFIYAFSELQSRPEDREFFNREIIKEAELWATKGRS